MVTARKLTTQAKAHEDVLWYKKAVFYELYVRAFRDTSGDGNGDLRGVIEKLDYLADLGVTCIWLLPIFPSPLEDDGYDVADYTDIHPDYGTLRDFKDLVRGAHKRGMRVITDLVLNHTSSQHPWFQAARSDPDSPFRDFYVWSDTQESFQDARIIFLDTETSNWSWDEVAGQYYWHRFYSSQPDLNYDNPAVRQEMLNVMRFWLELGIDGFRVDAIPYLFEREGTDSENLPETHAFLKEVRQFVEMNYPGCVLLSEANQLPEDVLPYFGEGDEMHMAFHFPLMPRIFMSLRKGQTEPIRTILDNTPSIPREAQWNLFLRNHDELTLEMVSAKEREWMWKQYAPEPRMKLNLGIRRRLAPLLDNDMAKLALAHSLLFTLPGSPTLYYGDEIGMGDNIWLEDRDGVRTPMQWTKGVNAGFSEADPKAIYSPVIEMAPYSPAEVNVEDQEENSAGLLQLIKRMIRVRGRHEAFCMGEMDWATTNAERTVLAYWRRWKDETLLVVNNLSAKKRSVVVDLSDEIVGLGAKDLFSEEAVGEIQGRTLKLELGARGYWWLRVQ